MSKERSKSKESEIKKFREVISKMIVPKEVELIGPVKPTIIRKKDDDDKDVEMVHQRLKKVFLTDDEQAHNINLFRGFLTRYKTNNQFVTFLKSIKVSENEQMLKSFIKEYTMLFKPDLSYGKYLRFINYNDYDLSYIFMVPFMQFFPDLPRRYYRKVVNKSVDQNKKRVNPKRKRLKDGTLSKVIPKKKAKKFDMIECSYTNYFIASNNGNLTNCVVTSFKVNKGLSTKNKPVRNAASGKIDHTRFETTKVTWDMGKSKGTDKDIVAQYGILQSYAYKQEAKYNVNMITGRKQKIIAKNKIEKRAKKLVKLQSEHGKDLTQVLNYVFASTGRIVDTDPTSKVYDNIMHKATKVLKKKAYDDFDKMIVSDDKTDQKIAKTLAIKFDKDLAKALKWK